MEISFTLASTTSVPPQVLDMFLSIGREMEMTRNYSTVQASNRINSLWKVRLPSNRSLLSVSTKSWFRKSGNGTISGEGNYTFDDNGSNLISANPDAGWYFDKWADDGNISSLSSPTSATPQLTSSPDLPRKVFLLPLSLSNPLISLISMFQRGMV